MEQFKKGDNIIVVSSDSTYYSEGETGIVDEDNSCVPYCLLGGRRVAIIDTHMKLIEDTEVNRLKGLKLKFDVTDNPELSEAIQKRVFELGGRRNITSDTDIKHTNSPLLAITNGALGSWSNGDGCMTVNHTLSTLDDLYHLPKIHTITIDGKDIELSAESFAELKAQLT